MAQKTAKNAIPDANSGSEDKRPEVKCMSYDLRDRRGSSLSTVFDEAMERVWRNCLYPENVTFSQYYRMYARNNVAARVIETFPDYCWAAIPFVGDSGGADSQFSKAVATLLSTQYKMQDGVKQSLLASMKQLDVLGGIGGESLLVFGFSDGRRLNQAVSGARGTEIAWVKILHNGQFEAEKRDDDEASPSFGDVVLYRTKDFTSSIDLNFSSQIAPGRSIHASRCVHFKESNGLSYGTSRIQKCYNQLLDITKLSGASAEVYWLGAFSGLSVETDPTAQLTDESYDKMIALTKKYFDGLARALVFEGATSKLLYPAIVSPKDHFDLQITMISIATGIPRRFLTGAEAAKLASQQDTLNWMERVTNRREMFVGPRVVAPVVQRCIDAGVVKRPRDDTFGVAWPRSQALALNERSDAARNMTAAWNSYLSTGMAEIVPFRVYLLYACGFSETEAEDIAAKTSPQKWKIVQKAMQKAAATAGGSSDTGGSSDGGTPKDRTDEFELRIAALEDAASEVPALVQSTVAASAPRQESKRKKKG